MSLQGLLRTWTGRIKHAFTNSPPIQARAISVLSEEKFTRYCPGGYHPVRIGDRFSEGKYEVISKLGYGIYSTVWLVRDIKFVFANCSLS